MQDLYSVLSGVLKDGRKVDTLQQAARAIKEQYIGIAALIGRAKIPTGSRRDPSKVHFSTGTKKSTGHTAKATRPHGKSDDNIRVSKGELNPDDLRDIDESPRIRSKTPVKRRSGTDSLDSAIKRDEENSSSLGNLDTSTTPAQQHSARPPRRTPRAMPGATSDSTSSQHPPSHHTNRHQIRVKPQAVVPGDIFGSGPAPAPSLGGTIAKEEERTCSSHQFPSMSHSSPRTSFPNSEAETIATPNAESIKSSSADSSSSRVDEDPLPDGWEKAC